MNEIQIIIAHFDNPIRDVTMSPIEDIYNPDNLPKNLLPLSNIINNSPDEMNNKTPWVTTVKTPPPSEYSNNISSERSTRYPQNTTVFDTVLVGGKYNTSCTIQCERADEVIVKNTKRDGLDLKHFNSLKEWYIKGLDEKFASINPKTGMKELENIYPVVLLVEDMSIHIENQHGLCVFYLGIFTQWNPWKCTHSKYPEHLQRD